MNRRNRRWSFELDHLLEVPQRLFGGVQDAVDAVIPVDHVHDTRHRRLTPAARLAGRRHRRGRGPVIRAIAREDLLAAGDGARDLEGILVGLGAAVGEEEDVDIAGRDRRELGTKTRARLRRHTTRRHVTEPRRLFLDRLDHARIAVPDIHAHQLAVEVDVALSFRCPEVNPLGAIHGNRIDRTLNGPLRDGVFLRQSNDFVASHKSPGGSKRTHPTSAPRATEARRHGGHSKNILRVFVSPWPVIVVIVIGRPV